MSSNREGYTKFMKQRLLAAAASAVVVAGLSLGLSAAPALAAGPAIAYNVTNPGFGAGYALFRDGQTHYRYATEAVKIPATIPNGVLGSVELYDQANMDAALIQLRCNGTTCSVIAGYKGATMAYENDIIGSFTPTTALTGTTAGAGDTVLLKLYYNPTSATHTIVFGAEDLTTALSFTNAAATISHPELFTEAGYGGRLAGTVTQAQENFYSSTGPAMPISVVSGVGGTGGLVRDDTVNLFGVVTLSPHSTLTSSSGGSFTLS
jgi:hypothetical protein